VFIPILDEMSLNLEFFDPQKWNCAFDTLWEKNGVDWTKPHGFMKGQNFVDFRTGDFV
jgi:hypothetical protein